MTANAASIEHIAKIPGICGGRACVVGHRIRVADIVAWHERRGYSPDEIVAMFPGLALSDVHAALAYYFDNRDEIVGELQADEDLSRKMVSSKPSRLRERLNG
jgi:uncharacterized protein (DUF433 family)